MFRDSRELKVCVQIITLVGASGSVGAVKWAGSADRGSGCGHEQRPVLRR